MLYKVQPTASSAVIAWALDENPDVAGYLVYRTASVQDLADLRWFGPDPAFPQTSGLASITIDQTKAQTLSFGAGAVDPRIIALVPDPRLCARDYDNSDMGEVPLPLGPAPDTINAIYRLSDYDPTRTPLDQPQAFNYWTPPATGGIAQLITDSPTQSRVTGLRIGLGRRTPVVVVPTFASTVSIFGAVAVRRAAFLDGVSGSQPLDPNALPGYSPPSTTATNAYAVVAVDAFGNRSLPSKAFAVTLLAQAG